MLIRLLAAAEERTDRTHCESPDDQCDRHEERVERLDPSAQAEIQKTDGGQATSTASAVLLELGLMQARNLADKRPPWLRRACMLW